MRPSLRPLVCSLLLPFRALAPPRAAAQDTSPHSLEPGAWALQFGVNGNFTLGSYQGLAISFKKHTAAARAWQVGVSVHARFDNDTREFSDDGEEDSFSSNQQIVNITAHYLLYPLLDGADAEALHLYTGDGPTLRLHRSSTEHEHDGESSEDSHTATRVEGGVSGFLGRVVRTPPHQPARELPRFADVRKRQRPRGWRSWRDG